MAPSATNALVQRLTFSSKVSRVQIMTYNKGLYAGCYQLVDQVVVELQAQLVDRIFPTAVRYDPWPRYGEPISIRSDRLHD